MEGDPALVTAYALLTLSYCWPAAEKAGSPRPSGAAHARTLLVCRGGRQATEAKPRQKLSGGLAMHDGWCPGGGSDSRRRRGFTLVELLVVITVHRHVDCLVAAGGADSGQEDDRRMQCGNNLKQLGVGFHNFDSANGGFPPRRWNRNADATGKGGNGYTGWGTFLLPFMSSRICTTPITGTTTSSTPSIKRSWKPSFRCSFVPAPQEEEGEYVACASAASTDRRIPTRARRTRSRDGSVLSHPTALPPPRARPLAGSRIFPVTPARTPRATRIRPCWTVAPARRGLPTS